MLKKQKHHTHATENLIDQSLEKEMATSLPGLYRRSLPSPPPAIEFASSEGKVCTVSLSLFCVCVCGSNWMKQSLWNVVAEAFQWGARRWNNGRVFQAHIVLPNPVGACVLRPRHPLYGPQCPLYRPRKKMEGYTPNSLSLIHNP